MHLILPLTKGHLSNMTTISWQIGWPYKRGTTVSHLYESSIRLLHSCRSNYETLYIFFNFLLSEASSMPLAVSVRPIPLCPPSVQPRPQPEFSVAWLALRCQGYPSPWDLELASLVSHRDLRQAGPAIPLAELGTARKESVVWGL